MSGRRRRGLLLLAISLASGGLAAAQVHERERRAAQRLGPELGVLVAAHELRAGARVPRDAIALSRIPARFAPPDGLTSTADVVGARVAVSVPAGGFLTASVFDARGAGPASRLRKDERAVTVEVAGDPAVSELQPGSRVDVLVSTEATSGGRTTMALAGAELLRLSEGTTGYSDGSDAAADGTGSRAPTALATLRVSLRQAIGLTQADNFAREIRLLPRPAGG